MLCIYIVSIFFRRNGWGRSLKTWWKQLALSSRRSGGRQDLILILLSSYFKAEHWKITSDCLYASSILKDELCVSLYWRSTSCFFVIFLSVLSLNLVQNIWILPLKLMPFTSNAELWLDSLGRWCWALSWWIWPLILRSDLMPLTSYVDLCLNEFDL